MEENRRDPNSNDKYRDDNENRDKRSSSYEDRMREEVHMRNQAPRDDRDRKQGPSYRGQYGDYYSYRRGPEDCYLYNDQYYYRGQDPYQSKKSNKMSAGSKAAIIILIIILCIVGLGYGCARTLKGVTEPLNPDKAVKDMYQFHKDYIGVVYLNGTITGGTSGDGYDQDWILDRVDSMREDDKNKGILLDIDTPGGEIYATKELYDALMRYKEETSRPIYAYLESQATSGGYYVAVAADKIGANIETWTGSIGVRVGTFYDISELLNKYGIKTYTITTGKNKDMGSLYKPMTDEQKEIMQSLVDESYDRFIKVVAQGREDLSEKEVRSLADGRIYSAQQAEANGLIDEITSLEDFEKKMLDEAYPGLHIDFEPMVYEESTSLLNDIIGSGLDDLENASDLANLRELMKLDGKVKIEYMSDIIK